MTSDSRNMPPYLLPVNSPPFLSWITKIKFFAHDNADDLHYGQYM